jgi:hypothetical protein
MAISETLGRGRTAFMTTEEDIQQQKARLLAYRRNLAVSLQKKALFGTHMPGHLQLEIDDARSEIQRIKAYLRDLDEAEPDHPDDEENSLAGSSPSRHPMSQESRKLAQASIYASLIDIAQLACPLETWSEWIYAAIMTPPSWDTDIPAKVRYFQQKIFGAVWPGTIPDLERALQTLSIAMSEMMDVFRQHAEEERGKLRGVKFYKSDRYFPPYFEESDGYEKRLFYLEDKFDAWIKSYKFFFIEMVKSANWLAEIVRREINPAFFAVEGKFLVPYDNRTVLYEYTEEEKAMLPGKLSGEIDANTYEFQT